MSKSYWVDWSFKEAGWTEPLNNNNNKMFICLHTSNKHIIHIGVTCVLYTLLLEYSTVQCTYTGQEFTSTVHIQCQFDIIILDYDEMV